MIWSNIRIDLSKMTVVFPKIVYAGNTTRNPDPEYHSTRCHKSKIRNCTTCRRYTAGQWEVRYAPKCYVQFSMSLRPVWSKAVARPVCRLYGILGHRIPAASMIQLNKRHCKLFSRLFSRKRDNIKCCQTGNKNPDYTKNPILISVVTRRVPIRRSSVVSFVNRARLRYKMMAALIMHIPVNRRDTSSFLQSMQPAWLRM